MKIVMLCDLYDERQQYQENLLAKHYAQRGHSVSVIASTFTDVRDFYAGKHVRHAPAYDFMDGAVRIYKRPYSLNLLSRFRRLHGVREILAAEQPDMIFVHDIHLNLSDAAGYKRERPQCRIVLDCHADYTNSASNWISRVVFHKLIRGQFVRRYSRFVDQFYAVVPLSAVFMREVYGIAKDRIELLPLGVDLELAREVRGSRAGATIRMQLGIPSDATVVFTGGKLAPLKKTHLVLEAVSTLRDRLIHLVVVGEASDSGGPYARRLRELAASDPRIHLVGWQRGQDVYSYMDACDFAVFPASQSVLWQQSLGMGLPLIIGSGTEVGEQDPRYLNVFGSANVIPRAEVSAARLSTEIAALAENPDRLRQLQAGALRTAVELLDYDRIAGRSLGENAT